MAEKGESNKVGAQALVASLAGAAVGAAVGAGAIILSDKKNRKRLETVLEGLKSQGFDVLDIVSREADSVKDKIKSVKKSASKKIKVATKKKKSKS